MNRCATGRLLAFLSVFMISALPARVAALEFGPAHIFETSDGSPLQRELLADEGGLSWETQSRLSLAHKILGYTTVALGLTTGILNPEIAPQDVHEALGYTSAVFAASTMAVGAIAHWDEVGTGYGFSSNNVHTILGIAGGTMMMIAPFLAPDEAHAALGIMGTLAMGCSITWKVLF